MKNKMILVVLGIMFLFLAHTSSVAFGQTASLEYTVGEGDKKTYKVTEFTGTDEDLEGKTFTIKVTSVSSTSVSTTVEGEEFSDFDFYSGFVVKTGSEDTWNTIASEDDGLAIKDGLAVYTVSMNMVFASVAYTSKYDINSGWLQSMEQDVSITDTTGLIGDVEYSLKIEVQSDGVSGFLVIPLVAGMAVLAHVARKKR